MEAQKLKGMTVVSISEASRLGLITDVLFETEPLRVAALRAVGEETEFVVPFELVRNLGADAVTVESSQVTQMASEGSTLGSLMGLERLQHLKVVDEAGTFVGTVHSAEVDPASGSVLDVVVRKGGLLGIGRETTTVSATAIRSVGVDVLTVRTGAAQQR